MKHSYFYIQHVLFAFGFFHIWIKCILSLISSSLFSIMVNGSPSKTFSYSLRRPHFPFPFHPYGWGSRLSAKSFFINKKDHRFNILWGWPTGFPLEIFGWHHPHGKSNYLEISIHQEGSLFMEAYGTYIN